MGRPTSPLVSDTTTMPVAPSVCYRSVSFISTLLVASLMADLPLDTVPDRCMFCEAAPARPGDTWCDECWSEVLRMTRLVAGETARRLAPEGVAFLIVLFSAPTLDLAGYSANRGAFPRVPTCQR